MALDESVTSSFRVVEMDDTQDSIDSSLIRENSNSFYSREDHGYICKVCNHKYASRRYVLFHLTNSHNIPTHCWPTCSQCGKIFTKPSKLAVHMVNHPKKKQDASLGSPTSSQFLPFSPQHSVDTARVKIIKSPTSEGNKVKQKSPKIKPLTVLFMRASLPLTYKHNPYKCGRCFKSFLTENERDDHRMLIHEPILCSEESLVIESERNNRGRKKTTRKIKKIKRLNKIKKKIIRASNSKNRSLSSSKYSDKLLSKKSITKLKPHTKRASTSSNSHSKIRSKSMSHLEMSPYKKGLGSSLHRSKSASRQQSSSGKRRTSERSDSSATAQNYTSFDPLEENGSNSPLFSPSSPGINIEMECIPSIL